MSSDANRTEPRFDEIAPGAFAPPAPPPRTSPPAVQVIDVVPTVEPVAPPVSAPAAPAVQAVPPAAPAVQAAAPKRHSLRLVSKRIIKSGLLTGKKFEVAARIDSDRDLHALFKGYSDELLLAYKSAFVDRSVSLRRSELLKGTRLSVGSLNEMIELEDRLQMAFDQFKRMVDILEHGDADVVYEG